MEIMHSRLSKEKTVPWRDTRAIIDCTEFEVDKPSNPDSQRVTWSYYKNRTTLKR